MTHKLTAFFICCCLITTSFAQKKINIPYFDPIEKETICGGGNCCPPSDICASISKGFFFSDLTKVLGRAFNSGKRTGIFNTKSFAKPRQTDIETPVTMSVKGKITTNKKKEFGLKVGGSLSDIIDSLGLTDKIKADLKAEISKSIENNGSAEVDMEYTSVNLSSDFIDNNIDNKTVTEKTYVITGLSLFVIKGNWSLNTLTDAFRNFELTASYSELNAELKAKYKLLKDRMLTASFSISSMAIKNSYRVVKPK